MVKQTKLFALPKFGSLRGSTSASLKIGENLAIRKKLASFLNWGSHLFYVTWWQIYYLCKQMVTGLLLMQTKLAKIRSSATRPLPKPDCMNFLDILSTICDTRLLIPLSAFGIDITLPLSWPDISFGTLHLLLELRFHQTSRFDLWVGQFVKSSISFGVSKMPARDKTRSTSFSGSENLQLCKWHEMSF